ncbi:MAG: penicillin-binding transpeptidase domain-containing protein [Gammaproteobacteria bacterium]|nr:penicillin-binding transpeptidase domain-containing protein [Gammaproteobacteria bacterium]
MSSQVPESGYAGRKWFLLALFSLAATAVACRVFYLQILNKDFLIDQGDARAIRSVEIPAYRGTITDRNGEPVAVSTPVASIWAAPGKVLDSGAGLGELANLLDTSVEEIRRFMTDRQDRNFVFMKRHVLPDTARQVRDLRIPGINIDKEYKRYYPIGEVASHLIGFTDIDDAGQEGIELAFDDWLRGEPGKKRVLKDLYGSIVKDIENISQPVPGRSLTLALDQRLQYLAYRELQTAVLRNKARGGMLLLLGVRTGEVLALAVQPPFNPNNRADFKGNQYRNRVVTDVFEPGSTIKPFTITAALMSGLYQPETTVDTAPGKLNIGRYSISDLNNYGTLSISDVIRKSSNVGTTKVALSLGPERLWKLHHNIGFGSPTMSGYPGEVPGTLTDYADWSSLDLATVSYGYGISVTTMQLAQAYSVIATGGLLYPISFQKVSTTPAPRRVIPEMVAFEVNRMMRTVIGPGGSGRRAAVEGYHIAGKTGTVHKTSESGYEEDRYTSLFAGFAPATEPRLVLVVVIDDPGAGQYFGGQVAAPVFSRVMQGALRILNIPPDNLIGLKKQALLAGNTR